jgi:hypothetical protein
MPLTLPAPVACYFEAQESRNVEAQTRCFAEDASVRDEGRDYRGASAISALKKEAQERYAYDCEPLRASQTGNIVRVSVRVTGTFPGSPVDLDHTFTLLGDRIISLVIE